MSHQCLAQKLKLVLDLQLILKILFQAGNLVVEMQKWVFCFVGVF
jgi:hypothetical protein